MTDEAMVLSRVLEVRAAETPEAPFLAMSGGIRFTYGEFNEAANRVMHGLKALGVGPGEDVAVMLTNRPEFAIASYALKKLRAVEVAINTNLRGAGLAHAFTITRPVALLTESDFLPVLREVLDTSTTIRDLLVVGDPLPATSTSGIRTLPFEGVRSAMSHNPAEHPRPLDVATVVYTSGTTGPSKACLLSHQYGMTMGTNMARHLGITAEDCVYCPFPMYHVDATYLTMAPALLVGGRAAIGSRFSVSRFWQETRDMDVTIIDFMGATLTMLWKQDPKPDDRDNPVRLAWGVPVPPFKADFERRFGLVITTAYGLTDGGMPVWVDGTETWPVGSCGRVRDPYELIIVDENDDQVLPGSTGEILLSSRTPGVLMEGYMSMPAETEEAMRGGWLHTGDLGHLDSEGYLYFDGRKSDSIRRRGESISAWEVEQVLEAHPLVAEAAVVGVPSALTEEDVKAFVVLRTGEELSGDELRLYCAPLMAKYMVPDYIEFVSMIPKTPTGKAAKHLSRDGGQEVEGYSSLAD